MNRSNIQRFFNLVCEPGEVYELRCPKAGKWKTVSGCYDNLERMANDAEHWTEQGLPGVYFTLNPVNPALLARAENKTKPYAENTTKDADISRRRLLLLDFDPVRPSGISSTKEEMEAAVERATACRDWLKTEGFSGPLLGMSGNGAGLLYRIDLPNDDDATALVKAFTDAIAGKYSDAVVNVDKTTFNASRVSKVYGTMARKGDSTESRPHRVAHIISAPERLEVVPAEPLRSVVEKYGVSGTKAKPGGSRAVNANNRGVGIASSDVQKSVDWVDGFIVEHSVEFLARKEGGKSACEWKLLACPFCNHPGSAVVVQADGTKGFHCFHNSCVDKHWTDFRTHYEPGWDRNRGPDNDKDADKNKLLNFVKDACELWHNGDDAYITVGNRNHKVGSGGFGSWLRGEWYRLTGSGIGETKFKEVVETVKAMAVYAGPEHAVHHRYARHGGNIYQDIGDDTGRVVEITPEGWAVAETSPVKFVRSSTTGVLPLPVKSDVRENTLSKLHKFVNLSDDDYVLFVGALLDAMKGGGPYLVVNVSGEQGSSKSTLCRVGVRVVDPQTTCELRGKVGDEADMAITASNRHVLAFDNISNLTDAESDILCRVSTGGGLSKRKLYTDGDESVFDFLRPVWLNGIEDFVIKSDLISRSSPLFALKIEEHLRRDEADYWADFAAALPFILGSLYDAVAHGLRTEKDVRLAKKPRMADTARWLAACLPALGWDYASWADALADKHDEAEESALDSSLAASCLRDWWDSVARKEHELKPSELYEKVKAFCPPDKERHFYANAKTFSNALRRLAPALRTFGLDYQRLPKRKISGVSLSLVVIRPVPTTAAEAATGGKDAATVARGCHGCQGLPDALGGLATPKPLSEQAKNGAVAMVASDFYIFKSKEYMNNTVCVSSGAGKDRDRRKSLATLATSNKTLEKQGDERLPDKTALLATTGNRLRGHAGVAGEVSG